MRILWSVVELAGFALVAVGTWTLSPGWGLIVGGLLLSLWAGVEELSRRSR